MSILAGRLSATLNSSKISFTFAFMLKPSSIICYTRSQQLREYEAKQADLLILRAPGLVVLLEHLEDALGLEVCMHGLVSPREQDTREAVKLFESNRRRRIQWHNAYDGAFNVWWRPEVILADVHNMVDLGV